MPIFEREKICGNVTAFFRTPFRNTDAVGLHCKCDTMAQLFLPVRFGSRRQRFRFLATDVQLRCVHVVAMLQEINRLQAAYTSIVEIFLRELRNNIV